MLLSQFLWGLARSSGLGPTGCSQRARGPGSHLKAASRLTHEKSAPFHVGQLRRACDRVGERVAGLHDLTLAVTFTALAVFCENRVTGPSPHLQGGTKPRVLGRGVGRWGHLNAFSWQEACT